MSKALEEKLQAWRKFGEAIKINEMNVRIVEVLRAITRLKELKEWPISDYNPRKK